jgi:phosphatidylserine decarboxylase
MSILATMKSTLCVGIHPKGVIFIIGFAALTVLGALFYAPLGWLFLLATIFSLYFFRNPDRMIPVGEGMVLASGDGVICGIDEHVTLPKELALPIDATYTRISIFLSVFNVHVNRVPVSGEVTKEVYIAGKFLNAALDKASEDNERSLIAVRTDAGETMAFVQIAGFVARRIVCQLYEGDKIQAGSRYGIIRFGSRCDVYVPSHYKVMVAKGSVSLGGETILAVDPDRYNPASVTWQKN